MNPADAISLVGLLLVGLAFLLVGRSPNRFGAMVARATVALLLVVLACLTPPGSPGLSGFEWFLACCGPALVALGLAGGRIMLERSVSLTLLQELASGTDTGTPFATLVHRRIQDLVRYGFVHRQGDQLALTVRGRFWAGVTRVMRRILGVRT